MYSTNTDKKNKMNKQSNNSTSITTCLYGNDSSIEYIDVIDKDNTNMSNVVNGKEDEEKPKSTLQNKDKDNTTKNIYTIY